MPITILGQQAVTLPVGTTAERPTGVDGMWRKNSTTGYIEYWDVGTSSWVGIGQFIYVTSGTVSSSTSGSYTYLTYTGSGALTITSGVKSMDYIIVAGGGAGGSSTGGGGGAGGVIYGTVTLGAGTYNITVGGGMTPVLASAGPGGGNSTALGLTAIGGGGGAGTEGSPQTSWGAGSGGSGGGGQQYYGFNPGGSGTPGQGNAGAGGQPGGNAGGGGGATQAGNGRNGGAGYTWVN